MVNSNRRRKWTKLIGRNHWTDYLCEGTWHFDRFLRAERDSFTLNTTATYNCCIVEVNGPINSNGRIRRLLLHFRQQDNICSIDMIKWYEWTLWSVPNVGNGLIYTQYYCRLWFRYFWNKWAISSNSRIQQLPLHFRQQKPAGIDIYERTLRVNQLIGS